MSAGSPQRRIGWICVLLALAAILIVLPFVLHPAGQFLGSDDWAAEVIAGLPSAGRPWFRPLWQPGSEGAKNALVALQAVLGMALLGVFFFALRRRRHQANPQKEPDRGND